MNGQFHDVRWVLAKNVDASYDVIPFGLVEVTGAEHDRSNRLIVTVKRPASDNPDSFAINGWQPIPVGQYGLVTFEGPVYVAYDTGTPAIGNPWGPQEDSFLAKDGNAGLIAFGTTTIGEGKTQKIALMDGGSSLSLVELCAQENAQRNTPYDCLLGTWNADEDLWCYDDAITVKAIDHRMGAPFAETNWKGLYQPMASTTYGTIYVCVSLDCEEPPEGCNECEGA